TKSIKSNKFKKNKKGNQVNNNLTHSDKIDKILTNKFFGIPIFLVILLTVFHLTFSENFLFIGNALGKDFVTLPNTAFEGVFGKGGINSPGVILQNLMTVFTDFITNTIAVWLNNSPAWVSGLICDAILGGLSAVLSFIPQILLLLLLFAVMEDSGYMARVAFIMDRISRKFGLSGRAFIPMIMGFGCSVPAMINTRTLVDEKERTATIRVIPFFSCGAKLPILTAITGGIVMKFGIGNADLITYAMYLLGITVAIISIITMKATIMKGEVAPFIMELPNYHAPQFKNLMVHLWDTAKHFIKKVFTIIIASTIVIWFVSHFSFNWKFLIDTQINQSILAGIGQFIQPLFTPLGFGSQLGNWGWIFVVASITGLLAKENVIATFATLATCIVAGFTGGDEGIEAVVIMITTTGITIPALIAFIAFNMTTIPCFAAVATAKAELPTKRKFNLTLLFWLLTSYSVGSVIYIVGSWWWSIFIFLIAAAFSITLIKLYNKGKLKFNFKIKKSKVKGKTICGGDCATCKYNMNCSSLPIKTTDD
ncbi:MAG: ferrous iron transporter B, partial [Clostridia bacterium]